MTVKACAWIDCWLYGIYSVSAYQKLMLVPEDMVKTEDVGYK